MTRRGTALQFLALVTIVLTQTLGACFCMAGGDMCPPLNCATEVVPVASADSDCCGDESDPARAPSCCQDLDLGWDLLPSAADVNLPKPAVVRLADFASIAAVTYPAASSALFEVIDAFETRPPSGSALAVFCVRLN